MIRKGLYGIALSLNQSHKIPNEIEVINMQPLKGIKVLDCSNLLPGPYCTMMMAAMGADVIKVEPAGSGDFIRKMMPETFEYLNRGKQSITLNLKTDRAREIFYKLVKEKDVMLEGFRPGVVKRLGIDFEKIKTINQNIIYIHKLNKRISYELNRVHGVITVARLSHNGRYLILKRLMQKGRKTLYGEMVILNIKTTKMTKMKMPYFFLDFSIPFEGNSIIFERKNRIVELSLDTRITSELIKRSVYSDIVMQTNPSIAFPSPAAPGRARPPRRRARPARRPASHRWRAGAPQRG